MTGSTECLRCSPGVEMEYETICSSCPVGRQVQNVHWVLGATATAGAAAGGGGAHGQNETAAAGLASALGEGGARAELPAERVAEGRDDEGKAQVDDAPLEEPYTHRRVRIAAGLRREGAELSEYPLHLIRGQQAGHLRKIEQTLRVLQQPILIAQHRVRYNKDEGHAITPGTRDHTAEVLTPFLRSVLLRECHCVQLERLNVRGEARERAPARAANPY